jgi:hypothetical protein
VQKPKPVVDVNLSKTPVTRETEVQTCFLTSESYSAKLAERNGIVLVEDMILAFQKVCCAFQLLGCVRSEPDNHLELMVAGQRIVFSLDVD